MKKITRNEEAVSPVIGVILMVAITVILAAVIAAFVFGMAGSTQKTKSVAATASQQGGAIYVTYQGGPDDISLSYLSITAPNGTIYNTTAAVGTLGTANGVKPTVGALMLLDGAGTTAKDHVIAAAVFDDASKQVILDTYV